MLKFKGVKGELKAGSRWAASLKDWSIKDTAFSSTISRFDSYWIEATDTYTVRLQMGSKVWQWKNVTIDHDMLTATATLEGKPEIREGEEIGQK